MKAAFNEFPDVVRRHRVQVARAFACFALIASVGTGVHAWRTWQAIASQVVRPRPTSTALPAKPDVAARMALIGSLGRENDRTSFFHRVLAIGKERSVEVLTVEDGGVDKASGDPAVATIAPKRARWKVHVRGDYRDIVALWYSLVDVTPGLVLDHLSMHRASGAPASSGSVDMGVQDADLEFTQWLRPSGLDRDAALVANQAGRQSR